MTDKAGASNLLETLRAHGSKLSGDAAKEIDRLRAENERLAGQVKDLEEDLALTERADDLEIAIGRERAEAAEKRIAELSETWTDESGAVWAPPTAWAYAQACKTIARYRDRTIEGDTATRVLSDLRKYARHHDGCAANLSKAGLYGHVCTCGFAALSKDLTADKVGG